VKILIVGDWHSELHEQTVFNAFKILGHEVLKFAWNDYFKSSTLLGSFNKKLQNRFITGPIIHKINRDLILVAKAFAPEMVFVYRGTHITADTLKRIKNQNPNVTLVGYNNDDPFAKGHPYSLWRHFFKAVPNYDLMLAYRHHNLDDFLQVGAKRVELLRSWYVSERNYPVSLNNEDKIKYECDVVFIGHYEEDGRMQYLEELVRQGFKVRIFGPEWNPKLKNSHELNTLFPVHSVLGEDYNKALCGAKIALCFLSKLNRDTYTRRCFEIPATGTLMLSEYSDDLASLYVESEELDFFRTKDELISKVKLYLGSENLRLSVASNGYKRVINDGHNVVSRMKQVLKWLAMVKLNEEKMRG